MNQDILEKIAGVLKKAAVSDPKERELWRLVNGLKKRGIHLSEKSILELKKRKGITLPPIETDNELNNLKD